MSTMIKVRLGTWAVLLVGGVLGAVTPARADEACTFEAVEGSFGGSFDAVVTGGPLAGPAAAQTRLVLRRDGNITGSDVVNFNGLVVRRTFAGTGTLTPDCTGSAIVTIKSSEPPIPFPPIHVSLVVTDRFREIRFIFTDPIIVGAGLFRRQH